MKLKKILLPLLVTLLSFAAVAQQKEAFPDEFLDRMRAKFLEIHNGRLSQIQKEKAQKEFEKELEKLVDEMLVKLKAWIEANKKADALFLKEYKPGYNHQPGEMNLFPIWEDIPLPVPSLPLAKQVDFKTKYEDYIEKIKTMQKQLWDMQVQHNGMQRASETQVNNDAKALANQSAVVQQLGGADALMKMSEAERKAAAKNLKQDVKSNPGTYSGMPDAGMNAMAKRIMADPAYRERYNKMTDAQKAAELQQCMSNKEVPRDDKAFEQSISERNKTYTTVNVQLLLEKCLNNMKEAAGPFTEGTQLADTYFNNLYAALQQWRNKRYEELPVTVMGETKEKRGVRALDQCLEAMMYAVQKEEAATRTILFISLKARTKIAFGPFNDFIGNYPWGKTKNASLVDGNYTEPQVAKAVTSLYDDMIGLAAAAQRLTSKHKGQQLQYETIMQ